MHKNNFDFLRFILAFTVILSHIIDLSHNEAISFLRPYFDSYISVTGFFTISGFLISKSFVRTPDLKDYFKKRANRLLPAYITMLLVCIVLLVGMSNLSAATYFTSPELYKYFFCNLVFLNFLQPCLPGVFEHNHLCTVNGALWTIKVEVTFYLIVPILITLLNKTPRKLLALSAIYIGSIAYKIILEHQFEVTGNKIFDTLSHQLPAFMSYFACGIAMHYFGNWLLARKNALFVIALSTFLLEYWLNVEYLRPAALSGIIFFFAFSLKSLNNFGKYGDFSYGIYIYHFPIIQTFIALGLFEKYNPWLVSAGIITIVLLLAVISWHVLEKQFLQRRQQRVSPTKPNSMVTP